MSELRTLKASTTFNLCASSATQSALTAAYEPRY